VQHTRPSWYGHLLENENMRNEKHENMVNTRLKEVLERCDHQAKKSQSEKKRYHRERVRDESREKRHRGSPHGHQAGGINEFFRLSLTPA